MLRKTIIFAVCAVSSASLPGLYQKHQARVLGLMGLEQGADAAQAPVISASPAPGENGITGRRVELAADGRGHFNGDFRLNGRTVPAMIDTGASVVALNRSTARRLGISPAQADFRHEVSTANGSTRGAAVTIDRLQIGRIDLEKVQAIVLDDKALSGTLIGMSFLGRLGKYQVENGRLLLEQ
ncbi:TIGR02281 family clan AA aspartic protease [Pseudaminobacter arsenicus]|uniref:TIGR02281 family clan AA aspartic protease n=1 Tax=Borborobacter arsenicus TaxID=1851146 RepID=A0A432V8M5_9HYPH|nr:TIGR02281 family clan AA aspartic protease [Pseudaminobacter arsenicus]RUM98496.1 TIGR02281 family clan AA aspartic protease [Pseudaminobacter arsenicus]